MDYKVAHVVGAQMTGISSLCIHQNEVSYVQSLDTKAYTQEDQYAPTFWARSIENGDAEELL